MQHQQDPDAVGHSVERPACRAGLLLRLPSSGPLAAAGVPPPIYAPSNQGQTYR